MEGPELRMEMEIQPALVPPALQFEDAIALARGMTFGQGQAARFGKNLAERHRAVIDLQPMLGDKTLQLGMPDIGPGAEERKINRDFPRHDFSPGDGYAASCLPPKRP